MKKTLLIVVNEHTLGYIIPQLPTWYGILATGILKGATFEALPEPKCIGANDKIRLASKRDFDEYRVCFDRYGNTDEYEYAPD